MMTIHSEQLGISIPITTEFQHIAQRFADICPLAEKAEQIKRNTLAVCAVNAYLQMMAIESDIAQADSWNPMMQMMADVADLPLPGVGVLSCRVADMSAGNCYVPPEDWSERMGYVAVVLDEAAHEATLIGFVRSVEETERVALGRFEAIEALIDEIDRLQMASDLVGDLAGDLASDLVTDLTPSADAEMTQENLSESESSANKRLADSLLASGQAMGKAALTRLGEWTDGVIAASWQAADALVNPSEVSFAFRTVGLADPGVTTEVSRAKLVDLGIQLGQAVRVALVIHIAQILTEPTGRAEGRAEGIAESLDNGSPARSNIVLQIRPLGDSPYLMENLVMTVLDETDSPFMSVTSRDIDNYIQLRLSGDAGESFKVRVAMGDVVFEEQFVI